MLGPADAELSLAEAAMLARRPLLLLAELVLVTSAAKWNYDEIDKWPFQCKKGQMQSPIDLQGAEDHSFEQLYFYNYFLEDSAVGYTMMVENNGHSVQVNVDYGKILIVGGGLESFFQLFQLHFHWGSEHLIEGKRFPLEMHLVHYNALFPSANIAMPKANGLAVLGVMFEEVPQNNTKLNPLMNAVALVKDRFNEKRQQLNPPLVIGNLMPGNNQSFYRYLGSLTTPDCMEGIKWTVFDTPVPIGKQQMDVFRSMVKTDGGKILKLNYRPVQPVNGRPVYYQSQPAPSPKYHASSDHEVASRLLVAFLLLLSIQFSRSLSCDWSL